MITYVACKRRGEARDTNPTKLREIFRPELFDVNQDQKNPRVHKMFVRNSGAGNGCANFMGASKKCALSAGKTNVHKIPRFKGGVFGVFGGGGSADFYFYGRADFSDKMKQLREIIP